MFNLKRALMKNFFRVSLIGTLTRCIADLMTLKQKLTSVISPASDPSHLNPGEYFIGNESCAEHLGVTSRTLRTYVAKGLVKSVRVGRFVCFKKDDVDEAVENVPALTARIEAKAAGKTFTRPPALITRCQVVSDVLMFVYMSYQGWRCIICTSSKAYGNQRVIDKLCKQVILLQHKIKPFRLDPNEN
jgi:excisionase family DNA binding protein